MYTLKTFKNEKFGIIRVLISNGEVWFLAKDIALVLGYSNASNMTRRISKNNVKTFYNIDEIPRGNFVDKQGLEKLLKIKLPFSKAFSKWIISEIFPVISEEIKTEICKTETKKIKNDIKVMAKCNSEQLPMILELFHNAGLDISIKFSKSI